MHNLAPLARRRGRTLGALRKHTERLRRSLGIERRPPIQVYALFTWQPVAFPTDIERYVVW